MASDPISLTFTSLSLFKEIETPVVKWSFNWCVFRSLALCTVQLCHLLAPWLYMSFKLYLLFCSYIYVYTVIIWLIIYIYIYIYLTYWYKEMVQSVWNWYQTEQIFDIWSLILIFLNRDLYYHFWQQVVWNSQIR